MGKHGVSIEEFALMLPKISFGYSRVKMMEQGVPEQYLNSAQFPAVTDSEVLTLQKYLPQLEKIFS